jgi:signal peptidase I
MVTTLIEGDKRGGFQRLPRPLRIGIEWVLTIGVAVLVVLALKEWVVNPYRIPSASMEPTLHCARPAGGCEAGSSDRVLANRFIYHLRRPHRGEIVVFNAPAGACGTGGTFVKRLIGLAGDRLQEKNGRWFVNGKRLDDSYVQPARRDNGSGFYSIPQGRYFFLGDNRSESCDSRVWGPVPRSRLIGPVFATYWPLNRISASTPGPAGAGILAALVGALILFFVLVRRRRKPS